MNILFFLIGLYILVESIEPISDMPRGLVLLCEKAKYVFATAIGGSVIYCAVKFPVDIKTPVAIDSLHILLALSVALFVWARMVKRWHGFLAWLKDQLAKHGLILWKLK